MNTTHNLMTRRLIATLGVAAAAAVTPVLLLTGSATAHAEPCSSYDASCSPFPSISDSDLGSVTAAPGSMGGTPRKPRHRCGRNRNLCRVHPRGPTCHKTAARSPPSSTASGSSGAG